MYKKKRLIGLFALLLTAALLAGLLVGCAGDSSGGSETRPSLEGKNISVVATIFPAYDWARQIIGEQSDRVALTLLLDKGADLHSYQPTVEDIYKISTCDIFIYVGGTSDKWVADALKQSTNPNMTVVCLMDELGNAVKEEELAEGMEGEEADAEEGPEYDEHVWLSLKNARVLCQSICKALKRADPVGAAAYDANLASYDLRLKDLDERYTAAVQNAERKVLLFADRFPFRYLTDDYGLTYYAAFVGCSAETEASFETMNFLVNKVDELALPYIIKLEGSATRLADTVAANSKDKTAQILELNSLQSVTAQGVQAGTTYLGVMEQNLEVLKTALGSK